MPLFPMDLDIVGRRARTMWRSFLARPHQHLLSGLCPVRRPCARSYGNGGGDRRRTSPKHLYVALTDSNGHALYKLDVADLAGDESDMDSNLATAGVEQPQRLPQPILRLSFRSFGDYAHFNALGSKIVVTTGTASYRERTEFLTLVYDTKTAKQDIQPFVPEGLRATCHTVAAGNKLYAYSPHSLPLYYLRDARAHPEPDDDGADEAKSDDGGTDGTESDDDGTGETESDAHTDDPDSYDSDKEHLNTWRERAEERWTWKSSPVSLPCGAAVKERTFFVNAGQAVHPDGRTIFLSTVDGNRPSEEYWSTFSLDTSQPGGEWRRLGDWYLPFMSKADYDRELDAWVAIQHRDDTDSHHLCSCDLPASTGGSPTPQPAWRLCKERLTFLPAPLSSMCFSLVHTGRGRFCLVEVAQLKGFKARLCSGSDVDQDHHLLQVTMFRASYGKHGELLATQLRPGRLYRMASYDPLCINQPPAFWM